MKTLFILDPLPSLNKNTDTSLALIKEAQNRRIDCFTCELSDIFLQGQAALSNVRLVSIGDDYNVLVKDEIKAANLWEFSFIFMRKDPPVDQNYLCCLWMLMSESLKNTKIINEPKSLMIANEKLFGLNIANKFFTNTFVMSNKEDLLYARKEFKKCVIKPLDGFGGQGVFIFDKEDKNFNASIELLTNNFTKPIIMQKYIEGASKGDKRILLLGGDILGAINRIPSKDDNRSNLHAGGNFEQCEVSDKEKEIILHLKPILRSMGLHFVGIDIIDGYLSEINVTSPTCLRQMEQEINGNRLSKKAWDYFISC